MGMTTTTMVNLENHNKSEEDQEIGEEVMGIEVENPPTQENLQVKENHPIKDRDLIVDTAGIVETIMGLLMKTIYKNPTDQNMEEMREGEEVRDTNPKRTEEVSMAMVAGVEKSARRP